MNNIRFDVDTTEMQRMVRYFSEKDWFAVKRRTLSKAGNAIKRDARKTFKSKLPKASHKGDNFSDRLIDAIRTSKIKNEGTGELHMKVHTMGSRKSGSGTFRTRFFEGGARQNGDRFQKPYVDSLGRKYTHGRNIGRIKPLYFFNEAVSRGKVQEMNMVKELEAEIVKLNNKKF